MPGRTIIVVSVLNVLVGLLVGCTRPTTGTTASLSSAAVLDDPAMQRRDWPQTNALYANGQVIADPTLWRYEPRHDLEKQWHYYFADTGAFLASVVTMPIGLFDPGADADVTYPGRIVPPSHFGVPPLHKRPCKCGKPADQCGNGEGGNCGSGPCEDESCKDDSCRDGSCERKDDACEDKQDEKGACESETACRSYGPTTRPSVDADPATQPAP